jgi:starch-binding outer membrane protein, SusD/RagB family
MTRSYLNRFGARSLALAAAVTLAAGACSDLTVPDYNNPSIEELINNPTPAAVRAAATGLLIGARAGITERTGYVSMLGIVGRESYTLDASDPRYVSELLVGPLTNSGAFGAGMWNARYANIRNANILLTATERVTGLSNAEKEAIRGYAKTIMALEFLQIINTRDTNGAPLEVGGAISEVGPFATKAAVLAHINTLLDEGRTHLLAGGSAFPFALSAGFAGFNTPATFAQFNRALKARVQVYGGAYAGALTALSQSFIAPGGSLTLGTYHEYSAASGLANELNTNLIYARPALVTEAAFQPGGTTRDARVVAKIGPHPTPRTTQGLTSDKAFTIYPLTSSPVAIIRNEELILLRAEARWFTGDKAGAIADLNDVRTRSGGLDPIVFDPAMTDAQFVTALLYERRYSLLMEGGHAWIDARRFGRLNLLPKDVASHVIVDAWSIPEAECLARQLSSPCDL